MNIQVHIGRLVLDGVPVQSDELPVLRTAVEKALGDILASEGPGPGLCGSGAVPETPGTVLRLPDTTNTDRLGTEIAQAVYSAIGQRSL